MRKFTLMKNCKIIFCTKLSIFYFYIIVGHYYLLKSGFTEFNILVLSCPSLFIHETCAFNLTSINPLKYKIPDRKKTTLETIKKNVSHSKINERSDYILFEWIFGCSIRRFWSSISLPNICNSLCVLFFFKTSRIKIFNFKQIRK